MTSGNRLAKDEKILHVKPSSVIPRHLAHEVDWRDLISDPVLSSRFLDVCVELR